MERYTAKADRPRETPGKALRTTNWGVRIERLGYTLFTGSVDSFGRTWKYRTFPVGSGSVGQFNTLGELVIWVRQVEHTRNLDKYVEYYNHLQSKGL